MKKRTPVIILILLFLSTLAYATTLVSVGNNIIRDTDGNLEWINHTFTRRSWANQTTAASALVYGGISDWRLPTKTELLTLVSSTDSPQIDPLFNLGPVSKWTCWTSTTAVSGHSVLTKKYAIFFGDGRAITVPYQSHKSALYVRDYVSTGMNWNKLNLYITWNDGTQMETNK